MSKKKREYYDFFFVLLNIAAVGFVMVILLFLTTLVDLDLLPQRNRRCSLRGRLFHFTGSDRYRVDMNEKNLSGLKVYTSGVPQGSVLGLTLFSAYMLTLGQVSQHHFVAMQTSP